MSVNEQDQAGDLLIQEVDEDLRREQYHKLWRLYGNYIIAGVVAIILGVAGHGLWLSWKNDRFQKDAAAYAAAEDLLSADKKDEGQAKLAEIIKANSSNFAMVAAFRQAELQTEANDFKGAGASFDAIAASNAPQTFRDLATIKSVLLTMDEADPELLAKRLQPIASAGNPWHFTATELLALLASRRGDQTTATRYYQQLADDAETPQGMRARATEMLAALGSLPTTAGKPAKG